ncbi:celZ [Scenedesmus sp. PABB004]|nr:celZ [Scenedesmus sp. PABB004]
MTSPQRGVARGAEADLAFSPGLLPPRTRADVVGERPAGGTPAEVAAANPGLAAAMPAAVGAAGPTIAGASGSGDGGGGGGGGGSGSGSGGAAAPEPAPAPGLGDGSGAEVPELLLQAGWGEQALAPARAAAALLVALLGFTPHAGAAARRLAAVDDIPARFTPSGDFDYGEVLGLSLLFYEAQRSGFLPPNQRVAWRRSAALADRAPGGRTSSAGDYVKFNLPQAFALTNIAWSILEFAEARALIDAARRRGAARHTAAAQRRAGADAARRRPLRCVQGYRRAGELGHAVATLKWGTDYLLKCDLGPNQVAAQVGLGKADHAFWRRPEDITDPRPVAVCGPGAPGSDVAGAMAAALAAASMVFGNSTLMAMAAAEEGGGAAARRLLQGGNASSAQAGSASLAAASRGAQAAPSSRSPAPSSPAPSSPAPSAGSSQASGGSSSGGGGGSSQGGGSSGGAAAATSASGGGQPSYAARCLKSAQRMYTFASTFKGLYWVNCSTDAAQFYPSHSFYDDLAWAAAWLYAATGAPAYLADAARHYAAHRSLEAAAFAKYRLGHYWDTTAAATALLLSRRLPDAAYAEHIGALFETLTAYKGTESWVFSPKGFAWFVADNGWGSLRHAANAALLMLIHATRLDAPRRDRAVCFAHGQIRYALGDAGRSFVVGYGTDPPRRVHHRAASCPDPPAPCDYRAFTLPGPNPRTITGALVGGPDPSDVYRDDRTDAMSNEVAVDYNAGFTGALAGLTVAPLTYPDCVRQGFKRQRLGR